MRYVVQDRDDKLDVLNQILDQAGLSTGECAFIGDDTLDVPVFEKVGLAVAVANAHDDAKSKAHFVTRMNGGNGAVREVTDLLLRAKRSNDQAIK
jgi:3-deoxy-D-manno-octulosonate 8-phosphate phosphatase (KDO 8-P phosphatase)